MTLGSHLCWNYCKIISFCLWSTKPGHMLLGILARTGLVQLDIVAAGCVCPSIVITPKLFAVLFTL